MLFFCEVPAAEGGATPIIPSHAVASHLHSSHPQVAAKLARLGVRYARVLPEQDDPSSPIGKSWRTAYDATTREEAEIKMREAGVTWEWLQNGELRTVTKAMPALVEHEASGRQTFFNAAIAATRGWADCRNEASKTVLFGDGTELDKDAHAALASVEEYMRSHRVAFRWQAGDVLLIDNAKAMHSRETFVLPRRILASLWAEAEAEAEAEAGGLMGGLKSALPLRLVRSAAGAARAALRLRGGGGVAPLTLAGGGSMPAVGLGLWKVPQAVTAATVTDAIRAGYRHLDCACDYGNEAEVGEGIRAAISANLVTREELWVTSKLWNTYHAKEHVEAACRRSLVDLGLECVDLYLVHFPIALRFVPFETRYPPEWIHDPDASAPKMEVVKVPMQETWTAMEALVPLGLAKHIGVCNFNTAGLRDLLAYATVRPSVLQVELHVYNQQPQLLRYCADEGIAVTGFSPLGAGSYVELGMSTMEDSALSNPSVAAIAEAKGVTPAQLMLRWALQRGTSVVPKSTKMERLVENLSLDGFTLSADEMEQLARLDQRRRYNDPGVFCVGMGAFCPIYD